MASPYLSYDDAHMWAPSTAGGIAKTEWSALQPTLRDATKTLDRMRKSGAQGFFTLPFDTKTVTLVERQAKAVQKKFDHLIVIGIGGSDLGARAIWQSVAGAGVQLHFVSSPDPNVVAPFIHVWKKAWKRTVINVVSKSGTTLETMAIFMTLRQALIDTVGLKAHAAHVYATTEEGHGALFEIAKREGYAVIPHPTNVGGRFSVLSSVGLFPAACGGVNVRALLKGAGWMEQEHETKKERGMAARFAGLHYLAYTKRKQNVHVLMPYADYLSQIAFWYRQLWGESLGKIRGRDSVGPTPVAAFGPVDQHSQIQLYNEGPNDKVITFIEVEKFQTDVRVPPAWEDLSAVNYIGKQSLADIMHAERIGTAAALSANGRPNGTLTIPSISPESVGALFQFYELATAYMGQLMRVNAFDQPGVEDGKKRAKAILETRL